MNRLLEISDAGDAYVFRTRLYVSFTISKTELDLAKADLVKHSMEKLTNDVANALKRASKQVPRELARLREAEEAAKTAAA